jgi:hypothetical protein
LLEIFQTGLDSLLQLFINDHETLANSNKPPNFETEAYMRTQLIMDRIVDGIYAMRKSCLFNDELITHFYL